jgi:hypothetical protein
MEKLNRKQRRQLPDRPTAEKLRNMQTVKLLNRLNNYYEMEEIIKDCKTIKQIKTRLQERIDATQKYLTELNKED